MNLKTIVPMGLLALVLATGASVVSPTLSWAKTKTTKSHKLTATRTVSTTKTNTNGLTHQAAALQKRINRDVTLLTNRDARLKARIDAKKTKGYDVSATQTPLSDYEKQIEALKGLTVPTNPTNLSELTSVKTNLINILKAAAKDRREANTALATAKKV